VIEWEARKQGWLCGWLWMEQSRQQVTQLLVAWSSGDEAALQELMPLVYDELRKLAHHYIRRERPGHTLQTSGLVNEAYLRLVDQTQIQWQSRKHFYGIAARLMRQILVDYARKQSYAKRGGDAQRVELDEKLIISKDRAADIVDLDEALKKLAEIDPRKSQIVELRFFGGLSVEETAEVLSISVSTLMRDWMVAKSWLKRAISS
jgi:RNA polymerase sigma-70 factor, ECF subfamily